MTEIQIEAIMEAIASQAAAAARIVGKDGIIEAAEKGNLDLVKDHVLADAGCVLEADSKYACPFRAPALPQPMMFQIMCTAAVSFNFSNFCCQGYDRVDEVLNRRTSRNHSFSRGERRKRGGDG